METQEPSSPQFPARLSRRLSVVQAVILVAVLIAGGLALFSPARIYRINALIYQEYDHALLIENVLVTFHDILAAANQIEFTDGALGFQRLRELEEGLERQMQAVTARQGDTRAATGEEREDALLGELQRLAADVPTLTASFALSPNGRPVHSHELERLELLAGQGVQVAAKLVNVHQNGVRQLLQMGQRRLRLIIALYVVLLLIGVAFVVIVGLVGNRWITAPLRRLVAAAELVAEGRLDARVSVASRDEIGHLSQTFNVMAGHLQARDRELRSTHDQLRRKISEIHALYQIGSEISGLTQLDPILRWVVDKARELVEADAAALCLLSPTGDELFLRASSGPQEIFRPGDRANRRIPLEARPPDVCAASLEVFRPERIQAHLPTVLRRADLVIGALVLVSATPREFVPDEHELVSGLATQAAIAIENARLYEEVQALATIAERRRLAQEIHDGVAQSLGLLYLQLRILQDRLLKRGPPEVVTAIQEATRIAGSVYEEARQAIFDLRSITSQRRGLAPILTEYLEEFRIQSGLVVALETDAASSIRLPPAAEGQVIRIIQEALSNVRRHAHATHAWVRLCREDEWVHLTVEDDGRGWDHASAATEGGRHFGLQTMRERAQSLGGTLDIDAAPGRGTRVTARVPAERRP